MGFYKTSRVEPLATLNLRDASGWHKSATNKSARSIFAQANQASVKAILESVADKFIISKEPEDFVFVAVRANSIDLPNGNGDAFPREELTSWNKTEGKPVYRTYEFKPHHVNHKAQDPRMARGVILDSHFNESDPDDPFIEILVAVDTKKDPLLAKGVADGTLDTWSMGCDAMRTVCSVCGNESHSPKDYCAHIKSGKLKLHKTASGQEVLAYEKCYEVTFQEISSVDDPADKTAITRETLPVTEIPSDKIEAETNVLELRARVRKLEEANRPTSSFQQVASRGEANPMNIEAAKVKAKPSDHELIATIYANNHELSYGDAKAALEATVKDTGKTAEEIQQLWGARMAEEMPHEKAHAICATYASQMKSCNDMKKAVKRTAEDMGIEADMVEKCAQWMKNCYRMGGYAMPNMLEAATGQTKPEEKKEATPVAAEAPVVEEKKAQEPEEKKEAAPKAATEEPKEAQEDGEKKEAEVNQTIRSAAQASAEALKAKIAQEEPKEASDGPPPEVKEKMEEKKEAQEPEEKAAAEAPEEEKKAQEGAPAEVVKAQDAPTEQVEKAQASDAKDEKSLAEMGVKSAAAKFPFAKFYSDVRARKTASGIDLVRGNRVVGTIPTTAKVTPIQALQMVASVGLVGAMNKMGGTFKKKADAGVAEGAVSDAKGGRGPGPQSVKDGAQPDHKELPASAPASATAGGETPDRKDKLDKKNLGNSDVRDGAGSDNKGGYEKPQDSAIGAEFPDHKDPHAKKNVGSDSVLAGRGIDMVLAGIDPKTAALIRSRLSKLAQEEKKEDKKAQEEDKEAQAPIGKIETLVAAGVTAKMAKFNRGLKLAAKRFALNLEPCDLKFNLGSVLCSRHEASGFSGIDDAGLVVDLVERGFNTNAAMETTVEHMIKRASEFAAMPDEALKAVEADVQNLNPVHPQASSDNDADDEGKSAGLRHRASRGSLPVLRSAAPADYVAPTKESLVRQAIGGGSILSRKYARG
jgi:hypothetical protein